MMNTYILKFHNWTSRLNLAFLTTFSFMMTGFMPSAFSQDQVVTVQFANPAYNCTTEQYCVDVEFLSNYPNVSVFGMNVRFFYDDNVLEFLGFSEFQGGYGQVPPNPPFMATSIPAGPAMFNFAGPAEWVNGAIQLINDQAPAITLNSDTGTKLYQMCFNVDDPNPDPQSFCPSIVWDLEENPENGGYIIGDDGVVITIVDPGEFESMASYVNVNQFNWAYSGPGTAPFGAPVENSCISFGALACTILPIAPIQCKTHNVVFNSEATGGCSALTYDWKIKGTGSYIESGQGTPSISVYVHSSPLTLKLTVTDADGNISICRDTVLCSMRRDSGIPVEETIDVSGVDADAFTPEFTKAEVIITEPTDYLQEFNLFPNPADNLLNLNFTSAVQDMIQLSLVNYLGQVVLTNKLLVEKGQNNTQLDISRIAVGNYLLQVKSTNEIHTKVIVIMR